jgi:hypothetical protein
MSDSRSVRNEVRWRPHLWRFEREVRWKLERHHKGAAFVGIAKQSAVERDLQRIERSGCVLRSRNSDWVVETRSVRATANWNAPSI